MMKMSRREETIPSSGDTAVAAFMDNAPCVLSKAVDRCADLLAASAQPLFAHLGVDVAGAREAILIAERTGGVIDHMASESLLRDLDPLRETGGLTTTPLEAGVRADVVLLLGVAREDPELRWLAKPARPHQDLVAREVIEIPGGESSLRALAQLRYDLKRSGETAAPLRQAKFGVAVWRASELPALAIEAAHGLVRDLNDTTRFSTLALAAPDNGTGVQTVSGWMTGFPLRTGFGRGFPEHDPWRYDAQRLIAQGETDCVVWVSALPGGASPSQRVDILIDDGRTELAAPPRVRIVVPSSDPGILHDPRVGALVASSSATSAAASALAAISARLEAAPC